MVSPLTRGEEITGTSHHAHTELLWGPWRDGFPPRKALVAGGGGPGIGPARRMGQRPLPAGPENLLSGVPHPQRGMSRRVSNNAPSVHHWLARPLLLGGRCSPRCTALGDFGPEDHHRCIRGHALGFHLSPYLCLDGRDVARSRGFPLEIDICAHVTEDSGRRENTGVSWVVWIPTRQSSCILRTLSRSCAIPLGELFFFLQPPVRLPGCCGEGGLLRNWISWGGLPPPPPCFETALWGDLRAFYSAMPPPPRFLHNST